MSHVSAKTHDPGSVTDAAGRVRAVRVALAAFLPGAALLLMAGEALTPKGLDKPTSSIAAALKAVTIGAAHPNQVYLSNMLVIFGLGALGVSFTAIATLARPRDHAIATAAALIGGVAAFCGAIANVVVGFDLAAAATAHTSLDAAARVVASEGSSAVTALLLIGYLAGGFVAIVLTGIALSRSKEIPHWLPVVFGLGLILAAASRPGITAVPQQLPFAVAMILLAMRVKGPRIRTGRTSLDELSGLPTATGKELPR